MELMVGILVDWSHRDIEEALAPVPVNSRASSGLKAPCQSLPVCGEVRAMDVTPPRGDRNFLGLEGWLVFASSTLQLARQ